MTQNQSILFSKDQIEERVKELAGQITKDYQLSEKPLSLIAMLKGSTYFLSDLTRAIKLPLTFDFISISKVQSNLASIEIIKDVEIDIKDHHVLVVEEIIRSGLTTHYMIEHLEKFEPADIQLVSLLANPDQLMINLPLKYIGFEVDYSRVIGYGMDYKEQYRNLDHIEKFIL